uniref:Ammonium transporter family protein n=1 Tax=Megaviridae environmental sample TaxID=1737588 RepID=A0A5J6VJ63_9VIRU|nr:MAG: ammonium transporter family protein [Megaviridae environmental sample]
MLGLFQSAMAALFWCFTTYDESVDAITNATSISMGNEYIQQYYGFFIHVHTMIFVGFGFLMTYLYKHMYSSVGLNFLISAFTLQWAILVNGGMHCLFNNKWEKIHLDIVSLICGDFAVAATLISFGAVLGRVSYKQLLVMAILECLFFAASENIYVEWWDAVDMGGSVIVHMFGAVFGLAVSWVLGKPDDLYNMTTTRVSETFAMIGCIFLWMFWGSFNGALAVGNSQHRVIINTVLALSASCVSAFLTSRYFKGKFDMVHVANATLAGGVIVGSSSDMVIGSGTAIIIGMLGGFISVFGYQYIQGFLEKLGIYDTCGVASLHGIPGMLGGLGGALSTWVLADGDIYGDNIEDIYPSMADGRTANEQSKFQGLGLLTSLGVAIVGGLLTGGILRVLPKKTEFYTDDEWSNDDDDDDYNHDDDDEENLKDR